MQRSRTESMFRKTWINEHAALPHRLPSLSAHSEEFFREKFGNFWNYWPVPHTTELLVQSVSAWGKIPWLFLCLGSAAAGRQLWQGLSYGSSAICMRTRMGKITKGRKFWAQWKIIDIVIPFLLWSLWGLHRMKASTLPDKVHSNLTVSSSTVFSQNKDTGDSSRAPGVF